uniref:Titin n=1 Tax=Mastacembelus armatus TaxID=205130 RepID=A0A7N8XK05_9TELE
MWQAPKSDGGTPITTYHIEKKDRTGLRWVKCNKRKVKDLQFKVTGLDVGHEYEFRITAENAAGMSLPSVASPFYKATDALYKPGAPCNARILDTTRSSITVAWNKPVYDGGSDITGYIVETCIPCEKKDEEEWTIVTPKVGLLATSFTIINLKENQEYKINISAINSEGIGEAASVPGNPKAEDRLLPPEIDLDAELRKVVTLRACCSLRLFVPIRGRPAPLAKWTKGDGEPIERATIDSTTSYTLLVIENVNRFDSGKYNLTVENMNDGGVKIKNYIVEKRESTRKAYATVSANCHQTTFTVYQLLEGCNYYFRVLAENQYGIGLPIETGESVKVSDKPQPPGKITLKDISKNSVTLSWEKPEHDGGSRIGCYVVEIQPKGSDKWTQAMIVKETEATISGLTAGEEYMFRVAARNEKGTSEPRQMGVPVIVKDLVIAPVIKMLFNTFSVLAGEDLTVKVPYFARPKAAVSWVKDGQPLKRTTRVNFDATDTILNLNIKEAAKDDVGHYLVTLSNTAGETTKDIGIIVLDKPGQPGGPVKVEEVTSDSVTISWNPPEYDGGCTIKNYILPEGRWQKANFTNIIETEYVATGLVKDNQYEFRVIARNAAGVFSIPSYSTGPITARDEIEPPRISIDPEYTQIIVVNAGENFKIDADVHGKPLPSIQWMKGEQELGNTIHREIRNTPTKAHISIKEAKLSDGGQYTLLLKNPGGEKAIQVNVVVLDKPGEPQGPLNLEVSNIKKDSMVLTWEAPSEDGGSPITGYIIEKHDKEGVRWTRCNRQTVTNLTFKVTGLLEQHIYEFRVAAENAVGVGEPSSPTVFYKALDPIFRPGPPHNPKVTDTTKTSIFLSWGKPVCDGGCEIQGYIIEYCTTTVPPEAPTEVLAAEAAAPSEQWIMCTPPTGAYKFRVCAINKVGVGEHADVSGAVVAQDRAEEPDLDIDPELRKIVTIKAGASLRLFIPIKGRPTPTIKWAKDEATLKETAQVEVTSSYTFLVIDKMSRNDSGKYTVTAENSSGTKSALVVVRVLDTPSAPLNLKVKEITNQSVTLVWEPPLLDGGNITGYTVEKRDLPDGRWGRANFTNVIETQFAVTGLTENAQYDFRVIAKNAVGTISKPSYNSGPITASDKVEAPKFSIDPAFTKTIIINAGETFKLDADVRGKPLPTIQWYKDEKPVENTLRLEIKNTENHAMIVIKDSVRVDGGIYTLQLTNEAG